jgi:phosphate-selective porin OprO/OprP
MGDTGSRRRGRITVTLAALGISALATPLVAQEPVQSPGDQMTRVVIFDVRLIGQADPEFDRRVNLLVENGRLVVVTEQRPEIRPGDLTVDANGGFVLGQLSLGEAPTIVILGDDPRVDFDVLLDTNRHVLFAMRLGEVVRNDLPPVAEAEGGVAPRVRTWSSYQPPPLAVPIRYYDSRKWNRFTTRPISGLLTGALVLDRLRWVSQNDDSRTQVEDLEASEGGEIRALRFGLVGTLNFARPWTYTVFAVTHAFDRGFDSGATDDLTLFDYRVDIPFTANVSLSVGKQKEPISHERLVTLPSMSMQERAAVSDALLPSRNHGLVLSGALSERRVTWAIGAFNNWIDTDLPFSETSNDFMGRVTWVPATSEDGSNVLHVGLGLRTSDTKQPVRVSARPEFNRAPRFVDTGAFDSNRANTLNVEGVWRFGPYFAALEYLGTAYDAPAVDNPALGGWHLTAAWTLTGEMRNYRARTGTFDGIPVARPVNQGGWGTVEAAVRYSTIDLTDGALTGGSMDVWSLGLNWWLSAPIQVSTNYRVVLLDRFGLRGVSSGFDLRLLLMLM